METILFLFGCIALCIGVCIISYNYLERSETLGVDIFFGSMFIAFGVFIIIMWSIYVRETDTLEKKYSKDTVFYKVKYNGKSLVIVNPKIKDGILFNDTISINAENGYEKIDRDEAIELLR